MAKQHEITISRHVQIVEIRSTIMFQETASSLYYSGRLKE
jgi:hypothetical protein